MLRHRYNTLLRKGGVLLTAFITSVCFLPLKALAAPTQMPDGILFDAAFYAKRYPDVTEFYESDDPEVMYLHYITFGSADGSVRCADTRTARGTGGSTDIVSDTRAAGIRTDDFKDRGDGAEEGDADAQGQTCRGPERQSILR